ncbi:MAG: SPFH domain-containing protein [Gammaproteobacteria bacterium]|nr:SPFH domain-containing protein [Gammaproteobacteria bacterium]MDH3373232.1 SPFH domain-containing protein [Gammaproteobacteria bacterium]MDH3409623.1 SPFH domain-containing protein [Gammaproteobacteria bacterium]MDH3554124.1 SPFH domain-containing protein [Gammaproteobacteria bacterium]
MARTEAPRGMVAIVGIVVVCSLVWFFFVKTVPPGRVGVATLFGNVVPEGYTQGIHVPVNPLYSWTMFDAREKTHLETANVPSQDQLQTRLDVSVQYRIDGVMAPRILEETGDAESAVRVHLIPKLRSLLREQGKSIQRAEDFFLEETQDTLQRALTEGLKDYLAPKGITVTAVLIRDITLPPFIVEAIERKKEREQAVERERAELERVRTELQQQVARAEAGRQAAEEEAARKRILADAQAYEITQINNAIAKNPAYIQLQSLEALKAISKDPASKMYFMDGSSPNPLPLMHLGDTQTLQR